MQFLDLKTCSTNLRGNGRSIDTQMIKSTARESAPLGGRRKRGEQKQAIGRSRGGRDAKIHALADAKGRLIAILLTGGEAHDFPLAKRLIRRVNPPEHLLGDMAYDGDELREELELHRTKSAIPNSPNRRHPFSFSKRLYKLRWRIESAFNRLKDFRRIATRYDKLGRNYLASVCLAAALVFGLQSTARRLDPSPSAARYRSSDRRGAIVRLSARRSRPRSAHRVRACAKRLSPKADSCRRSSRPSRTRA